MKRKDTVYRERSGGRWQFFTYSDGATVWVSEAWVRRQEARGTVRVVTA